LIWRHWRSRGMFGAPRRRRFSESNVGWGLLARAISRRGTSASCCARWWPRLRCCAASRTARLHPSWVSRPIRRSRSGRCGLPPRRRPSRRRRGRTRSPLRRRRSSSRRCQGQMRRIRIRWRPLSAGWRARAARPSRRCRLARAVCASSTSMTRSRTVRPRHRNSFFASAVPSHGSLASAYALTPRAEVNVVANDAAWVVQAWCVDDVSRGRLGLGADFCSLQRGARLRGGHRHSGLPP